VRLLEADGFAVVEAADGETALQAVHAGKPDLVLLDVMLPGIDGLEVTAEPGTASQTRPAAARVAGVLWLFWVAVPTVHRPFLRQLQITQGEPWCISSWTSTISS